MLWIRRQSPVLHRWDPNSIPDLYVWDFWGQRDSGRSFFFSTSRLPCHYHYHSIPCIILTLLLYCGPGSIVGIATGWTVRWSNPGGRARFSVPVQTGLGATQPPVQWVPGLFRVKERPGRDADPSPPSSAVAMNEWNSTSTPPMGRTACTEPQCLYKGALYLYLSAEHILYGWSCQPHAKTTTWKTRSSLFCLDHHLWPLLHGRSSH